jgi:uncharacterized protein (TIGR04255 family)
MAEITHLSRAPIIEAIIDFRIEPEKEFPLNKLSDLVAKVGDTYPQHEKRNLFESRVKIMPSQRQISQSTHEKGLHGFFFKSEDEQNIAQFRVDGFTFNHLEPYTSWDPIFTEAKRLWGVYADIMAPEFVTRIAVRYINRLKLPLSIKELSQYLTILPQIPDDLPKSVSSFLIKMVLVEEQTGLMANITQALESGIVSDHVPIIFDIDVYREGRFKPNDPEIWRVFGDLREMKNRIFFRYITDNTVELFR